ncbi:MAG: hypothetical protein U9R08_03690 [Nanoarchaeota archaeon]|nr:hypothetical protein [Nanoarchaeota archaeon]
MEVSNYNFEIKEKDGQIALEDDQLGIKIDTNRRLYIRDGTNGQYQYIGQEVPYGLCKDEKILYMRLLREKIHAQKLQGENTNSGDIKNAN